MVSAEELRVTVDGAELAVVRSGPSHAPAFLWAHGLTSSVDHEDAVGLLSWADAVGDTWQLLRYDARGHGASSAPEDPDECSWKRLARDMVGVADVLGVGRFVAGGASMGCATTLYAALTVPDRVRAMVLAIPPTAWDTRPAQAQLYEAGAHVAEKYGTDTLVEAMRQQPAAGPLGSEQAREISFEHLCRLRGEDLAVVLRGAARSDLPPPERLAALAQPALVLAWEDDPGHPVSTAEALVDALPAARLEVAKDESGVRRWPELVKSFLDEVA